jgi:putative molybdopterin biosynthesis protein
MPAKLRKWSCCGQWSISRIRILCTGSHDLAIGVLEDQLKRRHPELKIAAVNVGSLGGLLALQRGETHIAGTHLLDPTPVLQHSRYSAGDSASSGDLAASRPARAGILVARGNPKAIRTLQDLSS